MAASAKWTGAGTNPGHVAHLALATRAAGLPNRRALVRAVLRASWVRLLRVSFDVNLPVLVDDGFLAPDGLGKVLRFVM